MSQEASFSKSTTQDDLQSKEEEKEGRNWKKRLLSRANQNSNYSDSFKRQSKDQLQKITLQKPLKSPEVNDSQIREKRKLSGNLGEDVLSALCRSSPLSPIVFRLHQETPHQPATSQHCKLEQNSSVRGNTLNENEASSSGQKPNSSVELMSDWLQTNSDDTSSAIMSSFVDPRAISVNLTMNTSSSSTIRNQQHNDDDDGTCKSLLPITTQYLVDAKPFDLQTSQHNYVSFAGLPNLTSNHYNGYINLMCDPTDMTSIQMNNTTTIHEAHIPISHHQLAQRTLHINTTLSSSAPTTPFRSTIIDKDQLSGLIWSTPEVVTSTLLPTRDPPPPFSEEVSLNKNSQQVAMTSTTAGQQIGYHYAAPHINMESSSSSGDVINVRSSRDVIDLTTTSSSGETPLDDELVVGAFVANDRDRCSLDAARQLTSGGELRELASVYRAWITGKLRDDYWRPEVDVSDRIRKLRKIRDAVRLHAEEKARMFLAIDDDSATLRPDQIALQRRQVAEERNGDGDTLLHEIVLCGHLSLCRVVVNKMRESGIDLSLFNDRIQTPLHLAIICMMDDIAICIANSQPSTINDREMIGNNAVHLAVLYAQYHDYNLSTLRNLVALTTKDVLDAVNFDGLAPVHLAARHNKDRVIPILAAAGADINRREARGGATPLILASREKKFNAVRVLLELGANHYHRSSYGEMAGGQNISNNSAASVVRSSLGDGTNSSSPADFNDFNMDSDVELSPISSVVAAAVVTRRSNNNNNAAIEKKSATPEVNGYVDHSSPHYSGGQQHSAQWVVTTTNDPSPSTTPNTVAPFDLSVAATSTSNLDWPNTAKPPDIDNGQQVVPIQPVHAALHLAKQRASIRDCSSAGVGHLQSPPPFHSNPEEMKWPPPSATGGHVHSSANDISGSCKVVDSTRSSSSSHCSPHSTVQTTSSFDHLSTSTTMRKSHHNPHHQSGSKDRRCLDLQSYSACLPPQHQEMLRKSGNLRSTPINEKDKTTSVGSRKICAENRIPAPKLNHDSNSISDDKINQSGGGKSADRKPSATNQRQVSPPLNTTGGGTAHCFHCIMTSRVKVKHESSCCVCDVTPTSSTSPPIGLFSTYKPNRYVSSCGFSATGTVYSCNRKRKKIHQVAHISSVTSLPGIVSSRDLPSESSQEIDNYVVPVNRALTCRSDYLCPTPIEVDPPPPLESRESPPEQSCALSLVRNYAAVTSSVSPEAAMVAAAIAQNFRGVIAAASIANRAAVQMQNFKMASAATTADWKSEDSESSPDLPINLVKRTNSNQTTNGSEEPQPPVTMVNNIPLAAALNAAEHRQHYFHQQHQLHHHRQQGTTQQTPPHFGGHTSSSAASYDQTLAKLHGHIQLKQLQLQHQRIRQIQQTQQEIILRQQQLSNNRSNGGSPGGVPPPPPYSQAALARLQQASTTALQLASVRQQHLTTTRNPNLISSSSSATNNRIQQRSLPVSRHIRHNNSTSGDRTLNTAAALPSNATVATHGGGSKQSGGGRKMQPVSELLARLRGVSKDEITRMNSVPNAGKRARRIHNIVHLPAAAQQHYRNNKEQQQQSTTTTTRILYNNKEHLQQRTTISNNSTYPTFAVDTESIDGRNRGSGPPRKRVGVWNQPPQSRGVVVKDATSSAATPAAKLARH